MVGLSGSAHKSLIGIKTRRESRVFFQLRHFTLELLNLELFRLHLAVAKKGVLQIVQDLLHAVALLRCGTFRFCDACTFGAPRSLISRMDQALTPA